MKKVFVDSQIRSTLVHLPMSRIVFRPVKWSDSACKHERNTKPVGELVTKSLIQALMVGSVSQGRQNALNLAH